MSLPLYNITHSMSRAGKPTDNGAMEAINGWAKEELFIDFNINECDDVPKMIEDYIYFFNYKRPSFVLKYLTPMQFKEQHLVQTKYIKRKQLKDEALVELCIQLNTLCILKKQ